MSDLSRLKVPFPAEVIEWRIGRAGITKDGKIWATCLAYVSNRAIMDRLDDVVGPENWKNEFQPGPAGGVVCGLSLRIAGEWITKWDGAENTDIEAVKGGLSDAQKRAGVQWGIGRYLYQLEEAFAKVHEDGRYRAKVEKQPFRWDPPALPEWALPRQTIDERQKRWIEATVGEAARGHALDAKVLREKVKDGIRAKFAVEHFADLTTEQATFTLNKIVPRAVSLLVDAQQAEMTP